MSPTAPPKGKHAVVIGGSMAGLLAARVLLNHFERVTVLERDRIPDHPNPRPGVPQGNHVHLLLTQGARILEQLFPGLGDELQAAGAPGVNWTRDVRWLTMWGWSHHYPSDLYTYPCSRPLLEWLVYRHLQAEANLTFLPSTQVVGLLANLQRTVVEGVDIKTGQNPVQLKADLVVDASGRHSFLPRWLDQLGYATPPTTEINAFLGYSTRSYQIPAHWQAPWKVLLIQTKPPDHPRSAVLYPVEGNRWLVTLLGLGRDYPPTEEAEFLQYARSLRSQELYDAIKQAQPLSPIFSYRRTENCWHHYESLPRLPEQLVAVGDAVCAFNPFYAQGMTVAGLGALTLDQCLTEVFQNGQNYWTGFAKRFQKQLAQQLDIPWLMATSEDLRWPTTVGAKPHWQTRIMHRYMDQVTQLSLDRPDIYRTVVQVIHMVKSPRALFHPQILLSLISQMLAH